VRWRSSRPGVTWSVQNGGEVKGGCGLAETVSLGAGIEGHNNGMPGTALTSGSFCRSATLPDGGSEEWVTVGVDPAVAGRGSESELAVNENEMVGVSVGACVEWSEVAVKPLFSTLTGEWWEEPMVGVE
jgi:hypothetical protein